MRRVCFYVFLLSGLSAFAQQWQARNIAPCSSAKMTSAGVGFCEEYIYLSSSNGGVYQLYGTEDDWGTTPQPIAGGGYPSLFCAANRLTRTGDDALGYMVSCGPTFVATATYF